MRYRKQDIRSEGGKVYIRAAAMRKRLSQYRKKMGEATDGNDYASEFAYYDAKVYMMTRFLKNERDGEVVLPIAELVQEYEHVWHYIVCPSADARHQGSMEGSHVVLKDILGCVPGLSI